MRHLRAVSRLLLLAAGTAVLALAAWIATLPRNNRLGRRRRMFRVWATFACRVLGVRRRVDGDAPPNGLLIANHLSYLDVFALAASHDSVFVARGDMAAWPIVGSLCRFVGTVFIHRTRGKAVASALTWIEDALAGEQLVVLFPEGTSHDGREVQKFHPGLIEAALRASRPIGWAALSYFTDPGSPPADLAVCWWGDMTLPDHFYRLLQLPRIHAHITFGAVGIPSVDRKSLALRLRESIVHARLDHERQRIQDNASSNAGSLSDPRTSRSG